MVGTKITMSDGKPIETEAWEPSDLAQHLTGNAGAKNFAGDYFHVVTKNGESVWINPNQVVHLKRLD